MTSSINSQKSPQRRPAKGRGLFIFVATLLLLGLAKVAYADGPLDIAGYQGPSYPDSESNPSGDKPESKLWWHDGFWWGSLWSKYTST